MTNEYKVPEKLINSPMVMGKFLRSEGYRKVIQFITKCSAALVNTTMETEVGCQAISNGKGFTSTVFFSKILTLESAEYRPYL